MSRSPERTATRLLWYLLKVQVPPHSGRRRNRREPAAENREIELPGGRPIDDPSAIWVIIPAYNEAESIQKVVTSLRSAGYSVVVVDDGSSDNTAALARAAGATVLRHCQNLGQGGALWTGMTFCVQFGAQFICTFDADGQHEVEDIERMWRCLTTDGADIVLGSRFLGRSPGISVSRKLLLRLAIVLTRLRSGLRLTDAHNGLRLMRSAAARQLDLKQLGMAHASEIIETIARLGLRWCEVPVTVKYTEYSTRKGQSGIESIRILFDLMLGRITR